MNEIKGLLTDIPNMDLGKDIFTSHYIEILSIIFENPKTKREDVYSKLDGSRGTRQKRLDVLIENGLVLEEKQGLHNVKLLTITEKGIEVLQIANTLANVIRETQEIEYRGSMNPPNSMQGWIRDSVVDGYVFKKE